MAPKTVLKAKGPDGKLRPIKVGEDYLYIKPLCGSNKCIGCSGGGTSNGTTCVVYNIDDPQASNQLWILEAVAGGALIKNVNASGKSFDGNGNAPNNCHLWTTDSTNANQLFDFTEVSTGTYSIRRTADAKAVTCQGSTNNSYIRMETYTAANEQLYEISVGWDASKPKLALAATAKKPAAKKAAKKPAKKAAKKPAAKKPAAKKAAKKPAAKKPKAAKKPAAKKAAKKPAAKKPKAAKKPAAKKVAKK